ncbi:radical SAM protein [Halosquirtibacter laminarini]|uniref:Radical SAM protein n=1 Tax=Halosquirtibacter laminarini TaxID=3374600 RepID=A0AC61NDJ5_9BACT|nr:radical SAM protein [Prolixibacteraceae bacterium]
MEWSTYNYLYYSKKAKAYLLYSSLSNMLVELNQDDYNTILTIKEDPNCINPNDDQFKFLIDGRFLVESNANEVNKLMLTTFNKRFNSKLLSLTIAPTRACNFSCPYCYEEDRANKSMSQQVRDGILEFVDNKYNNIDSIGVIWYGGEPTLDIKTIKYLSAELQKRVKNYTAFMVTNGFLLDKLIDHLEDLKITGFQITLDGTAETHNNTRKLKNGKGSFDKIMSNIDAFIAKHDKLNISIRMNISTNNSDQYVPLFHTLREKFGNKVSLYPAFVRDYGNGCQAGSCFEDGTQKGNFLKKLFDEHGIYTKDIYPHRASKGCMVQQMNSFVVGPEGELYKCWHHLGVPEKKVGSIFGTQTITNYSLLSDLAINGDVLLDSKCKSCILFPSCYGGCMDEKQRNQDFCIPAKSMLEDFIDIHYVSKRKIAELLDRNK